MEEHVGVEQREAAVEPARPGGGGERDDVVGDGPARIVAFHHAAAAAGHHDVARKARHEHDGPEAGDARRGLELAGEQAATLDVDEALGQRRGQRTEALAPAGGEDHEGNGLGG